MTTIKLYTDLEQSRKLAEILPLESADAFYPWRELMKDYDSIYVPEKMLMSDIGEDDICAWSLAALLDILKDKIIFGGASDKEWFVSYTTKNPTKVSFIYKSNLVDACVVMIEKLHELNLL